MNINFDMFGKLEIPKMVLCNPDGVELEILTEIRDRTLTGRFTDISEFSFTAYRKNEIGEEYRYYDLLEKRRVVKILGEGNYIIDSVVKYGKGTHEYKEVKCLSAQCDFANKSISAFEGTYKFYDILDNSETILGEIIKRNPSWSIGQIDVELYDVHRTFDVNDSNLLSFMMNEVQKSYDCIFQFDTLNKTISAKKTKNAITKSDIYMSHANLVKSIDVNMSEDDFCTALKIYGGGDLTIHGVNPIGTDTIYDFSYYFGKGWMTTELENLVKAWDAAIKAKQSSYADTLTNINDKNKELLVLESSLKELETELAALNKTLSMQLDGSDTTDIINQITAKETQIKNKTKEIEDKKAVIKTIQDVLDGIHGELSYEKFFTKGQWCELTNYITTKTIINPNIIITEDLTDVEVQAKEQELYDWGIAQHKKYNEPKYEFSIDAVNFLNMVDFNDTAKQINLGTSIILDLDRGVCAYPALLEITINYDQENDLNMVFSDGLRLKNGEYLLEELFNNSLSVSTDVTFDEIKWNEGSKANSKVNQLINNAFDATLNEVINSTDQTTVMDSTGIRGRKLLENGDYSPNQYWLTNNRIAFTDDGWKTLKSAFGEFTFNGQSHYGVLAQSIVGRMIIGESLLIQNEALTFKVTGDKVIIKNGGLLITNDDGVDVPYEDKLAEDINNAINGAIPEISDAIKDGIVETYYQDVIPDDGSLGDLWFKTDTGKLYRHNGGISNGMNDWDLITDPDIVKAMEEASKAKEAVDGKITTYYQDKEPKNGDIINGKAILLCEGDLWVSVSERNKLYRYSVGTSKANKTALTMGSWDVLARLSWASLETQTWDNMFDTILNGVWVPVRDGILEDVENKVNNVVDPTTGLLDTDKMIGDISAGKNNITCLNSATNKIVKINEAGILIANSKTNGIWDWRTAISADGVAADRITSKSSTKQMQIDNSMLQFHANGTKVLELSEFFSQPKLEYYNETGKSTMTIMNMAKGQHYETVTSPYIIAGGMSDTLYKGKMSIIANEININDSLLNSDNTNREFNLNMGRSISDVDGNGLDLNINFGSRIDVNYTNYDASARGRVYFRKCNVGVLGSMDVSGDKPAIVATRNYGVRALYATEADKSYFTTNGNAETVGCECVININPMFLQVIEMNRDYPYIVSATPYSDARVWVHEIADDHIIVRSDKDTKFSYEIMAIRISYGDVYMEERNYLTKRDLEAIQCAAVDRINKNALK